MAPSAMILGPAGPGLLADEAAFFRDSDPWGFILFARNVEDPAQLRRLTSDLRDVVGRNAPILIDQEGGRVQRMRPPHWRAWPPVLSLFDGADEAAALEALRLQYRIIAAELHDVGIDVNCAPLADVLAPETHDIIGNRALGQRPEDVIRRARAVMAGLTAGGVLPVIKHMPGHGRAAVDSHISLPVVSSTIEELEATDFAPFRALADTALGMTGHVVFEAIDGNACATLSPGVIALIRDRIGFDGLLMTDDLSMQALSGPMADRARMALTAGCDILLHCNGDRAEMAEIASEAPELAGAALRRTARAEAARTAPDNTDIAAAISRYEILTAEAAHG